MIRRLAALFVVLAAPAWAGETRLTPETFERLSTGLTMYFTQGGELYGAEEYRPDRQVVWRFAGGECVRGVWWSEPGDRICFSYRNSELEQCWGFYQDEDGYFARAEGGDPANDIRVAETTPLPLPCEGPDAGV